MIQLIQNAYDYLDRGAIVSEGHTFTYHDLLKRSTEIAATLLNGEEDLKESRIAFLVEPGFDYVAIQWGIWRAGGIAVPLCTKHPLSSIEYVIEDTDAAVIVYGPAFETLLSPLLEQTTRRVIRLEDLAPSNGYLPEVEMERRAMILYTSGTTGRPKGVVSTHQSIQHQITALTTSWEWESDDHILNVLPMHHVHGIVNVTLCALWSGACVTFLPKFNPQKVFECFQEGAINVFMAVPTIYYKLIAYWKGQDEETKVRISQALSRFRLMVSGSAALPVSVLEEWKGISGQTLLERYGMTEMGMAISNPYRGERRPGHIGQPLPNVIIRIADEQNQELPHGESGEIQVKGPNLFKEYWGRPEATAATFTSDGWFKTGDIAVYDDGAYRILGRNSVDIIKSGGYKISALEIEEVLRKHPQIKECGVVGIPDEEWGEIIGASLITDGSELDLEELNQWLRERLPSYQLPRKYIFQEDLPRNVMGKVTKHELKKHF